MKKSALSSLFPIIIPIAIMTNFILLLGVLFYAAFTIFFSKDANALVPSQKNSVAVIRALDKITARVEVLNLPIGKETEFGTIMITAKSCKTTLPEETPPESAAFIEVFEGGDSVFSGWMFASSPALSAMEHQIYDIWVIGCKGESQ